MNYFTTQEKCYEVLASDDESSLTSSAESAPHCRKRRFWPLVVMLNIALFCVSISFFAISMREHLWWNQERNLSWRQANVYSPIIDDIAIPLNLQKMKGTFLDYDHDIYRQLPSPAVDIAWDKLTEHGFTHVREDHAIRMGWDLSITAKFPTSFNLGPETYYAGETDMIHKMHCLNMVRKDVSFKYYWGDMYPDGEPSERHKIHTSHCLYVILQSLMCDAHTDLIPHVYLEDYPVPVPDFEINRKCGNFEGVKKWEEENRVTFNETTMMMFEKPEGQKTRPMTDEFRRVFEVGN